MNYDFVIIGGGVAGLSAGARLAQTGRVCLLEAEDVLGYHASGRSAAMFEETYGKPSTIALNKASFDFLKNESGGVLSDRGLMLLGKTGEDAAFENDKSAMQMHEISFSEALQIVPILNRETIKRIGIHKEAWDIDTDLLLQNYARSLRKNGEIFTKTPATKLLKSSGGWTVYSGERAFFAPVILNAAGAWADRVAALAGIAPIGLTPKRRSMARIAAPAGRDVAKWPMMFGTGESWYAKPDAGNLIVSPADAEPMEPMDAWADDMILAEGLAKYETAVTEPVTRMLANWAGLRTFAPDGGLVLGPDPAEPSFFWVAGQGGYGMQSSPAASQFVADILNGRASELDHITQMALSPARLR